MTNEQKALLKTLQRALLRLRLLAYEGEREGLTAKQSEFIADLVDALHNIPIALLDSDFDVNFHTNIMLGGFDEKYQNVEGIKLLKLYQNILKNEI